MTKRKKSDYTRAEFEHDIKSPTVAYGGYTIHFITSDGASMSYEAAKQNKNLICAAMNESAAMSDVTDKQWLVIAKEINWEENELFCVHTGDLIPANYPNGEHQ